MNRPFKKFEIPSHEEKSKDADEANKKDELYSPEQNTPSAGNQRPEFNPNTSAANENDDRASSVLDSAPTPSATNENDDSMLADVDQISRPPGILDSPNVDELSDSELVKVKTSDGLCVNCKKEKNPYVTDWVSY